VTFLDEAFSTIIQRYTREAGVRNLEREISSICRKIARKVVVEGKQFSEEITAAKVTEYLGVPRFRPTMAEEKNEVGIATGLAWTEVGGEILMAEATLMPGKGHLRLTGQARRRDAGVGARRDELRAREVRRVRHPEGLQPEDRRPRAHPRGSHPEGRAVGGHHAGDALISALTKVPTRREVAMTGEITLRGKVLADRRREGKGAGGAPRRHQADHPAARQREGPGRHPEERARHARHLHGRHDGRGAEDRADRAADALPAQPESAAEAQPGVTDNLTH
jgi:ATP-dependent Lon protease